MDVAKWLISVIGGMIIGVGILGLLEDSLPSSGITPLFIALVVCFLSVILVFVLVEKIFEKTKKVTKSMEENIERKKQEKEATMRANNDLKEYQELKNRFQYFSDEMLSKCMKILKRGKNFQR